MTTVLFCEEWRMSNGPHPTYVLFFGEKRHRLTSSKDEAKIKALKSLLEEQACSTMADAKRVVKQAQPLKAAVDIAPPAALPNCGSAATGTAEPLTEEAAWAALFPEEDSAIYNR